MDFTFSFFTLRFEFLIDSMIAKILDFVKTYLDTIILAVLIMLFVMFSFAAGYIIAKYQDRPPIEIQQAK